jgi:hypothetical protein
MAENGRLSTTPPTVGLTKITKIRRELTLLQPCGDAALSSVSLGEPWVRAHPGLTLANGERGEPILSPTRPL